MPDICISGCGASGGPRSRARSTGELVLHSGLRDGSRGICTASALHGIWGIAAAAQPPSPVPKPSWGSRELPKILQGKTAFLLKAATVSFCCLQKKFLQLSNLSYHGILMECLVLFSQVCREVTHPRRAGSKAVRVAWPGPWMPVSALFVFLIC